MGQPTGRTAWRWRGDIALAGTRFSPTVELGRRVIFVADRRAFPGWGFFRTKRSDPLGFFSRHAERSCGGVVTEAWEPRKWLERVSAETIRRDGATRKRIHRSGPPRYLSQETNQAQGVWNDPIAAGREYMSNTPSAPCGGAGFSGRRAARDLPTQPPRRAGVFLFPENEPGPGFFFSLMGFPG